MKINKTIYFKNTNTDFDKFASDYLFEKFKILEKENQGKINIALSGGSTPLPILENLQNEDLTWSRYNFFLVDERCVTNEDSSSNFGNIQKVFFSKISSAKFSVVKDGFSCFQSISRYKDEIIKHVPISTNGFPVFDLILLGMGDDGHTASLFSGTKALFEKKEFVVFNEVPHLQTVRITLTFPVLKSAKEVIVILKGENKIKIVKEMYSGKPSNYPISKVAKAHSNIKWLIG
ncbi:MAG: 6-phosphogluconolactonase [Bacteroidota bacterium]|jgi:6-phosphogluconolactonase